RDACYKQARLEILEGVERSDIVTVDIQNSIDNRFTKLLRYLHREYPNEGWGQFLDDVGLPKWRQIAVAGHSQGGGEAAMIAKRNVVARVALFSAVPDSLDDGGPPSCLASTELAPSATPADPFYSLAHDCDGFLAAIAVD